MSLSESLCARVTWRRASGEGDDKQKKWKSHANPARAHTWPSHPTRLHVEKDAHNPHCQTMMPHTHTNNDRRRRWRRRRSLRPPPPPATAATAATNGASVLHLPTAPSPPHAKAAMNLALHCETKHTTKTAVLEAAKSAHTRRRNVTPHCRRGRRPRPPPPPQRERDAATPRAAVDIGGDKTNLDFATMAAHTQIA